MKSALYGSNGWFEKHGLGDDFKIPESVENRLKGKAIEKLRASGRIKPKRTVDVGGDDCKRPRLTGGCQS